MISTDLDTWAATLATATGIPVTRDPSTVNPPCILVGMPSATRVTIGEIVALDVPVSLVAPAPGDKTNVDWLLDHLVAFTGAITPTQPVVATTDVGDFPAYTTTVQLHVTLEE
jgi:hypothetical protein